MVNRLINLPKNNSFFLFGPRGSGKSFLLKHHFANKNILWIDLLNDELLDRYLQNPQILLQELALVSKKPEWVIIDEVQKAPKLLNVVHQIIESNKKINFALTGSSARKLKQKGVNLLAGRAWVENLFPFTHIELQDNFSLDEALSWGSLPKVTQLNNNAEKANFLRSYVLTYIKTEIQEEQWVRKIDPFRRFLPVAAQCNGQPLNYSKIAEDCLTSTTTIQSYYEILEDTLLGFFLPSFDKSVRKQQRKAAKFYFFDPGVKRSIERKINLALEKSTSDYGNAFEHWVICEMQRLNSYYKKDFELSYLQTKDGLEIDCIIDRPGLPLALVEIKSTDKVQDRHLKHLNSLAKSFKKCDRFVLSLDNIERKKDSVWILPWQKGLEELGFVQK